MPSDIIVATSDSAECTALRSSTMPIAPASDTGARIQNAITSPSGSSPCRSSPADSSTWLTMVPPDLDGTTGDWLAGNIGSALRRALLQRRLRRDGVVVLLVVAKTHRVRRRFHTWQQRSHQLLLGVDQLLPVVEREFVLVAHGE